MFHFVWPRARARNVAPKSAFLASWHGPLAKQSGKLTSDSWQGVAYELKQRESEGAKRMPFWFGRLASQGVFFRCGLYSDTVKKPGRRCHVLIFMGVEDKVPRHA